MRHLSIVIALAVVALCATVLPLTAAATWSIGGLTDAVIPLSIRAQTNGDFLVALRTYDSQSQVPIIDIQQFTPADNTLKSVRTFTTTSSVVALSPEGFALVQHTKGLSVMSLASPTPVDKFQLKPLGDDFVLRYGGQQFTSGGKELAIVYSIGFDNSKYFLLRRTIATGTSSTITLTPQSGTFSNGFGSAITTDGKLFGAVTEKKNDQIWEYSIETWNTETGQHRVYPLGMNATEPPHRLDINNNYAVYISSLRPSAPIVVDLTSGQVQKLPDADDFYIEQVSLSADNICTMTSGRTDAVGKPIPGQKIIQWDIEEQKQIASFPVIVESEYLATLPQSAGNVVGIVLGMPSRRSIAFYNVQTRRVLNSWPGNGHVGSITSTAWSPDGTLVASTGTDMRTMWHTAGTGTLVGNIHGTGYLVFGTERILLRASGSSIEKIDIAAQTVAESKDIGIGPITSLRRSDNGMMIAAVTAGSISVLSYSNLTPLQAFQPPSGLPKTVREVAFTTAGTLVALLSDGAPASTVGIAVWNISTGVLVSTKAITTPEPLISRLELSPEGRSMIVWDATTTVLRGKFYSTDGEFVREISFKEDDTDRDFDGEFSSDGSFLSVINREWAQESNGVQFRHVIRRIGIRDTASEVVGLSPRTGNVGALSLSPDNKMALYGFATLQNNITDEGVLEAMRFSTRPVLAASVNSIDFGTVYNTYQSTREVEITPGNSVPLIVRYIRTHDSTSKRGITVEYSHSLPDTIQPGEKRTLTVVFAPNVPTTRPAPGYIGKIVIGTADTYITETVVSLYGTTAAPVLALSATSANFSNILVGSTAERTIALLPGNGSPLTIDDFILNYEDGETDGFSFTTDREYPIELKADDSLKVTITYKPARVETRKLRLFVLSNGTTDQVVIPITAQSTDVVGVEEPALHNSQARVYPQPASSIAFLRCTTTAPGPLTAQLFSADGRLVATVLHIHSIDAGTHDKAFSVENIPAGVYFCRITTHDGTTVQPVVVHP